MREQAIQLKRHKNLGRFLMHNEGGTRGRGEGTLTSYTGEQLHYIQVEGSWEESQHKWVARAGLRRLIHYVTGFRLTDRKI